MPDQEHQFESADARMIWQELRHINDKLDKLNGSVARNTEYRQEAKERWRLHEKEHDSIGRNNVVASAISGVSAALVSFFGSHVVK